MSCVSLRHMLVSLHVKGCYPPLNLQAVGYQSLLIQYNLCYPPYLQAVYSSHNLRMPHAVLRGDKFTIQKFSTIKIYWNERASFFSTDSTSTRGMYNYCSMLCFCNSNWIRVERKKKKINTKTNKNKGLRSRTSILIGHRDT
jgi:hypothetical protein